MNFTPGPWPITQTGDGKRYVIGDGLVEGPNGYEVAEVYADDCDAEVALANARLIAAAPDLLEPSRDAIEILDVAIDQWNMLHPDEPDEVFVDLQRRFREAVFKASASA